MQISEHLDAEAIERYRRRELPGAELLSVQAHAAGCVECREKLAGAAALDAAVANLRDGFAAELSRLEDEPEHLAYEQLVAYVDGQLDEVETEIAGSHLAVCLECRRDAEDLRRYQAVAAESALPSIVAAPQSIWRRLLALPSVLSSSLIPAGAAAVVLFAAALLGVWYVTRPDRAPGSDAGEVARVEPPRENRIVTPSPQPTTEAIAGSPENVNSQIGTGKDSARPFADSEASASRDLKPDTPAPREPAITLALNDGGGEVTIDSNGQMRGLEALPPSVQQAVRTSLRTQKVATPRALDNLAGSGGVLMSEATTGGAPFALVAPLGRVVRDARPTLRWRPLASAASYVVSITDANFNVVAQSPRLTATEWTTPTELPRGANYFWQVTATKPGGEEVTSPIAPAPQAKFRVLDEAAFNDLKLLEKVDFDSHLARGVLYARAGLLDEAETEFEKLAQANPRSPLARKLLRSVRRR